MEKSNINRIIRKFLSARFSPETEEKVQKWIIEDKDIEAKEKASLEYWNELDVKSDPGTYSALERVNLRTGYNKEHLENIVSYQKFTRIAALIIPALMLEHYTIIGDLIQNDWRDIVQETKPEHLDGLLAALQTQGEMSITDIVAKITGQEIPVYREDEKGKMVEMSFADKALLKVSNKSNAEELAIVILFACISIQSIIEELKSLDKFKDNNGRLMSVYRDVGCLLSMNFKEMRVVDSFSQKK